MRWPPQMEQAMELPQVRKKVVARLLRIMVCTSLALLDLQPVMGAARDNGVYCVYPRAGGLFTFVQKHRPDGDLDFYLSLWDERGHFMGIVGTARMTQANRWNYAEGLASENPDDHCKVEITGGAEDGFHVTGDDQAACANDGGAGTEVGSLEFPGDSYAGPVTDQLEYREEGHQQCDYNKEYHPGAEPAPR